MIKKQPILSTLLLLMGFALTTLWFHHTRLHKLETRLTLQGDVAVDYAEKAASEHNRNNTLQARLILVGEPRDNKQLVEALIRQAIVIEGLDWDESEIQAMLDIGFKESCYYPNDQNQNSTAYGLWQFLDSTWDTYDIPKTTDPLLQTVAGVRYIKARYGSPTKALEFWNTLHLVDGNWVHYY